MRIGIYKVYFVSDQAEFNRLVNRYNIKAILFTDYKVVKEESERLIRFCEKKKIRMLLLPSIDELQGGKIQLRTLPEVRIEDLLGREEIRINMEEIANLPERQSRFRLPEPPVPSVASSAASSVTSA